MTRLARALLAAAVHLLPRQCRWRYEDEFDAELLSLPRRRRPGQAQFGVQLPERDHGGRMSGHGPERAGVVGQHRTDGEVDDRCRHRPRRAR